MKSSLRKGFSFGLTSGVTTTLGLIVGLNSSTNSKIIVITGILIIAIADAMSDALGVHVSEESENKNTIREVWEATIATFLSKFVISLTFVIPIVFLQLKTAIITCIIWGLSLIVVSNYYITKQQKRKPLGVILEHLILTIIVITITHYIGTWLSTFV